MRLVVRDRGARACRPLASSRTVATLALLSKPISIFPKSPPRSIWKSSSSLGGVAVLVVDAVAARALPTAKSLYVLCSGGGGGGGGGDSGRGSSATGSGG